jgi:hypothetical protein
MIEFIVAGWMSMAGVQGGAGTATPPGLAPIGRARFEAEIRTLPGAALFDAIERNYPDEYRALIDTMYRQSAAHPGDPELSKTLRTRSIIQFYKRRTGGLANAPAPALNRINARQLALIRALARDDVALCAEFATTAFIGKFDLPASYQPRASALGILMVEAAKLGESQAQDPNRKALAEEDGSRWYESLLRIEPSREVEAAIAGEDSEGIGTPEMQCRIGLALYAAIEKLAPEQAANVAAYFLAQTLAELAAE